MLVAVFDDESKALEASKFLAAIEVHPDVFPQAVVRKNLDGSISIEESSNIFPSREIRENRIDSLIDLLADVPIVETSVRRTIEMDRAGVDSEFLRNASSDFVPGKFALVSDIRENLRASVDNELNKLGGRVFLKAQKNLTTEPKAQP